MLRIWYVGLKVLGSPWSSPSLKPPFQIIVPSEHEVTKVEWKNSEICKPRGAVSHCHWINFQPPKRQHRPVEGTKTLSDEVYSLLFPDLDTCGNPAPFQLHRFNMRRNLAELCGCSGDDSLRCKVGSSPSVNALLGRLLFTRCNMFPSEIRRACA